MFKKVVDFLKTMAEKILENVLQWLLDTSSHPIFAIIVAIIMSLLMVTNIITAFVGVSVLLGCGITFLWISRWKRIKTFSLLKRVLTLFLIALFLAGMWYKFGSWALGKYYQQQTGIPQEMIKAWAGHGTIHSMMIDGKYLSSYKNKYNLLLIGEVPMPGIDTMTSKSIKKSVVYTITDGEITLVVDMVGIPTPIQSNGYVIFYTHVALIPKNVSPDKITTLSDVERMGGKIIARRGGGNLVIPREQSKL